MLEELSANKVYFVVAVVNVFSERDLKCFKSCMYNFLGHENLCKSGASNFPYFVCHQ